MLIINAKRWTNLRLLTIFGLKKHKIKSSQAGVLLCLPLCKETSGWMPRVSSEKKMLGTHAFTFFSLSEGPPAWWVTGFRKYLTLYQMKVRRNRMPALSLVFISRPPIPPQTDRFIRLWMWNLLILVSSTLGKEEMKN